MDLCGSWVFLVSFLIFLWNFDAMRSRERRYFWYLRNGPAYRSIRGENSMSEPQPSISSNKTCRCLMITLCYQTHPSLTRTHKHSLQISPLSPYFASPSAHSLCFWAAKCFIKTSKRIECVISPAAWVWEDFNRNLELDFLCNLYSSVIFSHPIQSAEAACFFLSERGTEASRMRRGGAREFGKISKCQLKPTISLISSITCCLYATIHPLSSVPGLPCGCIYTSYTHAHTLVTPGGNGTSSVNLICIEMSNCANSQTQPPRKSQNRFRCCAAWKVCLLYETIWSSF